MSYFLQNRNVIALPARLPFEKERIFFLLEEQYVSKKAPVPITDRKKKTKENPP